MFTSQLYTESLPKPNGQSPVDIGALWERTLDELSHAMTQATFDGLLRGSVPVSLTGDVLTVIVPSRQAADWLNNRLKNTVSRALGHTADQPYDVVFIPQSPWPAAAPPPEPPPPDPAPQTTPAVNNQTLRQRYEALVQPQQVESCMQYFRQKWRPLLGPVVSELIRELRQLGHQDHPREDLSQATVEIAQADLAEALGISFRTLKRVLRRDAHGQFKQPHLERFILDMQQVDARSARGRIEQKRTRFVIRMHEPLTPADEEQLTIGTK